MRFNKTSVLTELDVVLDVVKDAEKIRKYEDWSGLRDTHAAELVTTLMAAIERFSPPESTYITTARDRLKGSGFGLHSSVIGALAGIVKSLRSAYERDALDNVGRLIQADLFGDFLEMSQHLVDEGYKDAGAVMTGSVLEEHLRKLCDVRSIPTETSGKPMKADTLNAELTSAGAYNKLDQKNVTAWLDLRNKAAHGHYADYTADQVRNMLGGVRTFIAQTI